MLVVGQCIYLQIFSTTVLHTCKQYTLLSLSLSLVCCKQHVCNANEHTRVEYKLRLTL